MNDCDDSRKDCSMNQAQLLVGGKWKMAIIWILGKQTRRFNELQRSLPGVTQKMLTQQLRELEAHHLVNRKVYPVVPPKVEYSLTEIAIKLLPIFDDMRVWGKEYLEYINSQPEYRESQPS